MDVFKRLFSSTIGSKQLVGFTGLALALFVFTHMAGNLLIFVGPEAYNEYSYALISNPLIYVAEGGLLLAFVAHLGMALALQIRNWKARPVWYAVKASGDKGTSATARTLWAQGLIILVFVVVHLMTFKFGKHYTATYDGETIRDLHGLVLEVFQSPIYVGVYTFCLVILGFHLCYGVKSAFQTLGIHHPKYTPAIRVFSWVYGIVVAAGFISCPIYVFFIYKG